MRFLRPGAGTDGQGSGTATAVPLRFRLLPQALQSAGYETLMIGKWHLGYFAEAVLPTGRGFESFFGYYGAGDFRDRCVTGHEHVAVHMYMQMCMYI